VLLVAAGCSKKAEWQEFSSPDGRFSITFPAKAEEEVKTLNTAEGPVEMHEYLATLGNRAFLATYSDYAKGEDEVKAETRLAGWRAGVMKGRTLITEREMTVDGLPGRELIMDTPEGLQIQARAFYRGKRLFQALVAAPKGDLHPDETTRFLGSLKITAE
jgi:hypothetical protein